MLRAVRSPLFLALAALAIFLAGLEMKWPCFFLHDDNATWFAGAYAHDFRTLTQTGRLAEVNFFQYGGEPFLEQGQTGVLYPPVYVAAALASVWPGDLRWTVDWLAALHLALAVAGFYAWLRRAGMDATLAALGGLAWALNPFVLLLGASWITVTAAAAWLPWLFWALDGVVLGSRRPPGVGLGGLANPESGSRTSTSPVPGGHGLPLNALALGVIAGMFILQGYVQWAAYAFLFAGLYAAFGVFVRDGERVAADGQEPVPPRGARIFALSVSGLVALALSLPQILPLLQGTAESKARAEELSPMFELFYRVEPGDLLAAQLGFFREHFLFGASTALFFCPALVLLPLAVMAFARGDEALRRRLFPLLLLAVIALVFSGRGYFLLNVVPFMAKFRWPFKVFLFAEFFLLAAFIWSLKGSRRTPCDGRGDNGEPGSGARSSTRPAHGVHGLPLAVVLLLEVGVALAGHEANFLSAEVLPSSRADLPMGMDPALGRVIAMGDRLPEADAYRFFTHAYGTYYEVPSIGGYNPLVSWGSLDFALGINIPNFYDEPITPELRAGLESRAVRYWIVDADSTDLLPKGDMVGGMARFRPLASDAKRLVLEDTQAQPMAFDEAAPQTALPVRYAGNSMLIQLGGAAGTIAVSVGPTQGWWYRVDETEWKQSRYSDFRLLIPVGSGSRELEVSYFDPELREGLCMSLVIIALLAISACFIPRLKRKAR